MSQTAAPAARGIELIVAAVGASALGIEIAAARLLAPYFGTSTIIWANTIATVLLALSIGYWIGGRIADRDPTLRGLCRLVLIAGLLLAAVPFIAHPFLSVAIDALDSIAAGAFVGSLLAVLALAAIPLVLLGAIAPYAVRLSVTSVAESGRVTGRLYAISTIGSLVGVFLAALLLIPFFGTQLTFLAFALILVLVAATGLSRRALIAPLAVVLLMAVPTGSIKAASPGRTVLEEQETDYGFARIVQTSTGDRWLELNEGVAIHSLLLANRSPLTGGYWDEQLVLPFTRSGRSAGSSAPSSVAILGNAGGTMARSYGILLPQTQVTGVEIDGRLTELGERWLDLRPRPSLTLKTSDARLFLRTTNKRFDAITVDAYRQPYVPFHLATKQFFELVRDHLNPGGVVIINVGHPSNDNALEKALTATVASVFGPVLRDPAEPENTQLIAGRGIPLASRLKAADGMPAILRATAAAAAERIEPGLRGGSLWTDDKAPVEWTIDGSIIKIALNPSLR